MFNLNTKGTSRNNISYTPQMMSVTIDNTTTEYNLMAEEISYHKGLNSRAFGELLINEGFDENPENYRDLTKKEARKLIADLNNPNAEVTITVFPEDVDEDEDRSYGLLNTDKIENCEAEFSLSVKAKKLLANFKFNAEIIGVDC